MQQYLDLVSQILDRGVTKGDRTGTGTISLFGHQMRFDLGQGFPLVTVKRTFFKGVAAELLWFIAGNSSIRPLVEQGVSIWTDWPLKTYNDHLATQGKAAVSREEFEATVRDDPAFAEQWGDLGPVYGVQWRSWPGRGDAAPVDQLRQAVELLRTNPDSRRIIVNAWNPAELDRMALSPCHMMFQFNSRPLASGGRALDCQIYQRSCDVFLGVPFNIASYALLTAMMAQVTDHIPGDLVWTGGDVHLYTNHIEQAREMLTRTPRPLPTLHMDRSVTEIDDFRLSHIRLSGYEPHGTIKAPVAV